jgi:hypothetical protein
MAQYRRKPSVIDAIQYTGTNDTQIVASMGEEEYRLTKPTDTAFVVSGLSGDIPLSMGSWLIKSPRGEFYPIQPDAFVADYEAVK